MRVQEAISWGSTDRTSNKTSPRQDKKEPGSCEVMKMLFTYAQSCLGEKRP